MHFIEAFNRFANKAKEVVVSLLGRIFEITSSIKSKMVGFAVGGVTLLAVVLLVEEFTSQEFAAKWYLLAFALMCPFLLGFCVAYNLSIKNDVINKVAHLASLFVTPIVAMTMSEALNGIYIYDMTYLGFFANYVTILMFYFLLFGISGSLRITYLIVNSVIYGFALAHSYILEFRGTPFLPMDFLSITTAAGVANTYDYTPTYKIICATLIFIFMTIIAIKTKTPKYNIVTKVVSRCFTGTFSFILAILFFGTSVFANLGVKPDFWNQARGYRNYGFVWNFFCNTKYLYKSAPNNYNPGNVGDYIGSVVKPQEDKPEIDNSYTKPNIICIMNESLSDLSVLGEFSTNEDYMPFMRNLTENTIKGNLYVPVIGAGTSNTEFEFLTGHSTAFLPSGSNAYMLYVKNPIASLVSTVEAQGYSSYALHPYYAKGWRRTEVYNNFGLDKFISLDNLIAPEIFEEFQSNGSDPDYLQQLVETQNPENKNMLVRQYVSDQYNFKLLIDDFKGRDKSKPYFAFNVTMQNHGGYTTSATNFNENIYVTSVSQKYEKTDKYLSLIKYTDDAFRELIQYFSSVKEPTVICMFGDHQPSIENEFIAEVMGVNSLNNLTPEQNQSRYCTPFYIWANYDIEEKQIDKLSVNYLSSLVLQTAGIKLTEYNKYLLELAKTLPVIDTAGYIDSEGIYYKWSDASPYKTLLDDYEKVQYNNIFDQQNVNAEIFYLNGFKPQVNETEEVTE